MQNVSSAGAMMETKEIFAFWFLFVGINNAEWPYYHLGLISVMLLAFAFVLGICRQNYIKEEVA